jgi:class 3 adenylate cyclase/tetratricopeptide (TPR) repeat protein/transcriptional regulator with XRE-family HTH domain
LRPEAVFGSLLREARESTGISLRELARRQHRSHSNLWDYERGHRLAPAEVVQEYELTLDLATGSLLEKWEVARQQLYGEDRARRRPFVAPLGGREAGKAAGPGHGPGWYPGEENASAVPAGRALPAGTVTFVFSDIEGSTRLLRRLGHRYIEILERHRQLLRSAITDHGGVSVNTEGDGELFAFGSAMSAVAACIDAQTALQQEPWPDDVSLRVRMGIHTGEAAPYEGDYVALALHRAARVADACHGGQVLLSEATEAMVADELEAPVAVRELGAYVLKDFDRPARLFQLCHPSLCADFPPLRVRLVAEHRVRGEPGGRLALPARLSTSPPFGFVGRSAELDRLAGAWNSVRLGHGRRLVLVSGELGIGKTSLVAEAARRADREGATVLYGRCDEGLEIPYQPAAEALTQLVAAAPEGLLAKHVGEHGGLLSRLVPTLAKRLADVPAIPSTDPETERWMLVAAMAGLLSLTCHDQPLLLILDDIHWADRPTLAFLRHLVAVAPPRLLIVATYRDTDVSTGHPLADAIAFLSREPGVERLALSGLGGDDLAALVEAAAGQPLDRETVNLADALHRDTDGNPFLAGELLRHRADSSSDGGMAAGLPTNLTEVIRHRVAHHGKETEDALAAAAVMGQEFDAVLLAKICEQPPDKLLDNLDYAEASGLITANRDQPGRYGFAHALFQQTIYEDLGSGRRAKLHRRTALVLEELNEAEESRVAELAHHWVAAGRVADVGKAVDCSRRAGESALAQLAPDQAATWFTRALELCDQTSSPEPSEVAGLLIGLGAAQRQGGDPAYRETLLRAGRVAQRAGETDLQVKAALANTRGFISSGHGRDDDRIRALEDALGALGSADKALRARLLATLSTEQQADVDWQRSQQLATEARAIAREVRDPSTLLYTLSHVGLGWLPDTLEARIQLSAEAMELSERMGDPVAAFFAAIQGFVASLQSLHIEQSDSYLARLVTAADEVPDPALRWVATTLRSVRTLVAGDIQGAEELADEALQIGMESGQPDAMDWYGGTMGAVRVQQGRFDELVPILESLASADPRSFQAVLAFSYVESGNLEAAADLLRKEHDSGFSSCPHDGRWLQVLTLWARVAYETGNQDAGAALLALLEQWDDQAVMSGVSFSGAVVFYTGLLSMLLGRSDDAEARLARAVEAHTRLEAPYFVAMSEMFLGQKLLEKADAEADEGLRLIRHAARIARDHGYAAISRDTVLLLKRQHHGTLR